MAKRMVVAKANGGGAASPVAIRDVAALAGVSVATVSRVLNGRPDVAPQTRDAVMRHIREVGYVSNRSARALAGGRTGLVGLTVPHVRGEFFTEIVAGAAEALADRDSRLVVCPTQHEHDREVSLLERLMHGLTDGALLIMPSESSRELARLRKRGYPAVVVDPTLPVDEGIPVVAAANWAGGRLATEHLIMLGHRRIGLITGPATWCASVDRLAGYHLALLAAGLPADRALVREGAFTIESGYQATHQLLALPEPPSAIFALSDEMAVGVLRAVRERGLTVPADLSVVGFDDVKMASVSWPALTTIRQPLQEMGRVGAGQLFRLLDGQQLEATRIELSTRLIIRDSTASPRGTSFLTY